MDYKDWKVGDRVVCIKTSFHLSPVIPIVEGEIYTIKDIAECTYPSKCISILLKEIKNPEVLWSDGKMGIPWYQAKYFRKLLDQEEPKKTDISIFQKMLKTVPELEKV